MGNRRSSMRAAVLNLGIGFPSSPLCAPPCRLRTSPSKNFLRPRPRAPSALSCRKHMEVHMTAYPLLPIRDLVVFPGMRLPLYVGRRLSVGAVSHAVAHDLPLFLIAQRQSAAEQPKACDLYTVGTLATVVKRLPLDNGSMKIEVMARERARLVGLDEQADRIDGRAEILAEPE